jgi:hypothetical protein
MRPTVPEARRFIEGVFPGAGEARLREIEIEGRLCPDCGEEMSISDRSLMMIPDPPQVWTDWVCPNGHMIAARYEDDWLRDVI